MRTNINITLRVFCLLTVSLTTMAAAQSDAERTFARLRESIPQATAANALELRVRWLTAEAVANPATTRNGFVVTSVRRLAGGPPRERSPQVSSESLVVVSVDAFGAEVDWRIAADSRIVRSEGATSTPMVGERLYYLDADLRLLIPDLPGVSRLKVYQVRGAQGEVLLDLVGAIDLPAVP